MLKPYWLLVLAALTSGAYGQNADISIVGTWQQGALLYGQTAPDNQVLFNGRPLRLSPTGQFVFGLDRDAPAVAELTWINPAGAARAQQYTVAKRSYKVQKLNGFKKEQIDPPADIQVRIAAEAAQNKAARVLDSNYSSIFTGFAWPARGAITGVFGSQRILNGVPKQPHYGLDIAGPVGAPVKAPMDGMVTLVNPDMYFSGGTLYVDHGYGVSSAFLHLSKIVVAEGQWVRKGEKIAEIGATGRVTGAHLDWRVNWFESRVDAQHLVGPQ